MIVERNLLNRQFPSFVTLPNLVSVGGLASTVAWMYGASPAFAIAGLLADEVDGKLARARSETSNLGSNLDWGIDMTLTGAMALSLGIPWLLIFITPIQCYLRSNNISPAFGSFRAGLTVIRMLSNDGKF